MSKNLGGDLRTIRRAMNLNREKFAALVGVSGDSIRNYERGKSPGALATAALAAFVEGLKGGGDVSK